MQVAKSFRVLLFVVVGLALAGAPLLHSHPLTNETPECGESMIAGGTAPCSACAIATARAIVAPPAIVGPDPTHRPLIAPERFVTSSEAVLSLSSRAPPAV